MGTAYTVAELNHYLATLVKMDPRLSSLRVMAEISGVKRYGKGRYYFVLKDGSCRVKSVVWESQLRQLQVLPEEGKKVVVTGFLNVYEPGGYYSIDVRGMEPAGEGDLAAAFRRLKERLLAEGLFDAAHKKPLPLFPKKVAVVTAATGAAVQDICKIIKGRNTYVNMYIFPVPVQGPGAAPKIAQAIDFINQRYPDMDVMIVGRGGGSLEDLWAFNEEVVARAIYRSEIPIISGVGHQPDESISDLVADVRAATPTDAANLAVPNTFELRDYMELKKKQMGNALDERVKGAEQRLQACRLPLLKAYLLSRVDNSLLEAQGYRDRLQAFHPLGILKRGYAVVTDAQGQILTHSQQVQPQDVIQIQLGNGRLVAKVQEVQAVEEEDSL